ncbi:MAG TPA: glycosyltransferase family 39 protein [Bryobacteraceae bacterium]|nr:glycosyltransferase family 39 protein [Bryobacteraceae bacterium]
MSFSVLYLAGTGVIASRRFLWADEVVTAYMARLSVPQLWSALRAGADIEPPLFHLITRLFTSLFGQSLLTLRLPALLGGWLMCMSLYVFVSRRLRPVYGAIAMLIPFATGAAEFIYEARCYGIALGFAGVALVCWQGVCEGRSRRLSLPGLALSMAAAIACHYYMVLVVVAIGLGEALRSVSRARIDLPVWTALTAAIIPLPLHLPLIRAAMTFSGGNWWSAATPSSLLIAYRLFFMGAILPLAAVLAGLALWEGFGSAVAKPAVMMRHQSFRPWEVVVAFALAMSLVGAFLLARLTNGIFTLRYGICMVFGAALLPLPVVRRYDGARPIAGTLCFLVLAGSFVTLHVLRHQTRFQTPSLLLTADRSSAIVVEDPLDFMELAYNAPSQITSRLYYLTSRPDSIRYIGNDDDERQLLLLRRWFPIQTEDVREFLKHHQPILIWRGAREQRWLLQYLIDQGATTTLQRTSNGESLFLATQRAAAQ